MQKQHQVAAPAPAKAVKPSPQISSPSLLLMTARRLRAVVIFLLQGSNAEAAPTSSPLLHQHQLLPPLPFAPFGGTAVAAAAVADADAGAATM